VGSFIGLEYSGKLPSKVFSVFVGVDVLVLYEREALYGGHLQIGPSNAADHQSAHQEHL
jgi:hypothetical protein